MQNRTKSAILLAAALLLALPAAAQVYFPGVDSEERTKAAEQSKATLKYDPRDFSGIWSHTGRVPPLPKYPGFGDGRPSRIMGGALPPPLTLWGLAVFVSHKPSLENSWQSRRVRPALGNDPVGSCDPLGYPRSFYRSTIEFVQTPNKIVQLNNGQAYALSVREIFLDGRNPAELYEKMGPRWDGWAVGHWEGDSLVVESTGFDERSWIDGNGWPHSETMKLREVWRHPNATTLEVTMTIDDPQTYTQPWVGNKQTLELELPKDKTMLYESYCVPSEEEEFNQGVRNPAGGSE
jgi:hypothetical protein